LRIDQWLRQNQFVESRAKAQALLKSGAVELFLNQSWKIIEQPSFWVSEDHPKSACRVEVWGEHAFVSRAARKLQGALARYPLPAQSVCVDLGQSTGGFTQVLLDHGAARVVGVEVGHGQLHPLLRRDSRVKSFEGLHIRDVFSNSEFLSLFPKNGFDLLVADLSFISLRPYIPLIAKLSQRSILLIKPQFEVGPKNLTKHFRPKKVFDWLALQKDFCAKFEDANLLLLDWFPSTILGKQGNQEFLAILTRASDGLHTKNWVVHPHD
jgi:23S rRNA (cytidine1920-2'-O)/16S rRNA (cytidine1409-2'-O)-methyltransferase